MSEVWGNLAKSAVDGETIEEAIDRIVSEHNSDAESHLGAGESLAAHKADEVLDHPARSVLYDKFSASELIFQTFFENENAFNTVGTPDFQFPGFNMHPISGGFSNRDEVYIGGEERGLEYNLGKAMRFQFSISGESLSPSTFRVMIATYDNTDTEPGIGLSVVDGVAKFYFSKRDGSSTVYLDWDDWAGGEYYIVRIEYDPTEEKAYFYINGDLLGELSCPLVQSADWLYIQFRAFNTTAGKVDFNISSLSFQLEP